MLSLAIMAALLLQRPFCEETNYVNWGSRCFHCSHFSFLTWHSSFVKLTEYIYFMAYCLADKYWSLRVWASRWDFSVWRALLFHFHQTKDLLQLDILNWLWFQVFLVVFVKFVIYLLSKQWNIGSTIVTLVQIAEHLQITRCEIVDMLILEWLEYISA